MYLLGSVWLVDELGVMVVVLGMVYDYVVGLYEGVVDGWFDEVEVGFVQCFVYGFGFWGNCWYFGVISEMVDFWLVVDEGLEEFSWVIQFQLGLGVLLCSVEFGLIVNDVGVEYQFVDFCVVYLCYLLYVEVEQYFVVVFVFFQYGDLG